MPAAPEFSLMLDPARAIETIMNVGMKKAAMPLWKMIVMGVLGGFYVTLGCQAFVSTTTGVDVNSGPNILLGGVAFSVSLMLVTFVGAELFTGNCLILVAVLAGRTPAKAMLKDWAIVFVANFVGCIYGATLLLGAGTNGLPGELSPAGKRLCQIAHTKADLAWYKIFFRGVLANTLVALAILVATVGQSPSGKILGIGMIMMVFIVNQFDHGVAALNMWFFSMATLLNCDGRDHGWYWLNLLLSTLGNIAGASSLAAVYYLLNIHGHSFEAGKKDDEELTTVHEASEVAARYTFHHPGE